MTVEVKSESGCWSVYVNGARMVDRESYTVASHVADALTGACPHHHSESHEVADAIRDHLRS